MREEVEKTVAAYASRLVNKYSWTPSQVAKEAEAEVFVSFRNLDAKGRKTKDCFIAKTIAVYLQKRGCSVSLSLDSLEQLGKFAYMEAIGTAL